MKIEIILAIIVPLIAVPIIALIGFFLKGLLKSVQLAISKQSVSIEKLEKSQNDSLKGLDEKFTSFQLTIQKVFLTLTSVEKDLERANENLNKTNQIANRNSELIAEHKNKIFNLDNNLKQLMTELKEQEKKVDLLTRSLFELTTNCEK
jgi:ABC-type transporter Mla subunit MlaD|tara:strand:+ start:760 stop:1206 length:447 start_codon:yes stop_codon:yes gene_type:complete